MAKPSCFTQCMTHQPRANAAVAPIARDCERAEQQGVTIYAPPKPARNKEKHGDAFTPRAGDSDAIKAWRTRMGGEPGKEVYKQRGATSETINAQMRRSGLIQLTVRGLQKAKSVALWAALAYNVTLFAKALMS